jgi:hypothetical protein
LHAASLFAAVVPEQHPVPENCCKHPVFAFPENTRYVHEFRNTLMNSCIAVVVPEQAASRKTAVPDAVPEQQQNNMLFLLYFILF